MKTSDSIKQIAGAMLIFHDEVNNIPKSAQNPFFKSKYVPLDKILTAIAEPLKTARLSFMQFPKGENELETIIMHESGEWMSECFYMKPVKADPQSYGSVITYQRRYALSAILGLNTDEDDDGNKGSSGKEELIDADTQNYIESLIHTSTYDDDMKANLLKRVPGIYKSKAQESIDKLMLSQKSDEENDVMSQKNINNQLNKIDKDERK